MVQPKQHLGSPQEEQEEEGRAGPITLMLPTPHFQKGLSELIKGSQAGTGLEVGHL